MSVKLPNKKAIPTLDHFFNAKHNLRCTTAFLHQTFSILNHFSTISSTWKSFSYFQNNFLTVPNTRENSNYRDIPLRDQTPLTKPGQLVSALVQQSVLAHKIFSLFWTKNKKIPWNSNSRNTFLVEHFTLGEGKSVFVPTFFRIK